MESIGERPRRSDSIKGVSVGPSNFCFVLVWLLLAGTSGRTPTHFLYVT
jgi:hypothetical protein